MMLTSQNSMSTLFVRRLHTIRNVSCNFHRQQLTTRPVGPNFTCIHAKNAVFKGSQASQVLFHPQTISNGAMRVFSQAFSTRTLFGLLSLTRSALTHPSTLVQQHRTCRTHAVTPAPEIEKLFVGNKQYLEDTSINHPGLLKELALKGQKPQFVIFDCSDSRVSEQAVFSARPGTLFTASNIANQFHEEDLTSNAVLSYAVETLAVKHVIIMGHYGCGGVAAAMLPAPDLAQNKGAVQRWIQPIREIYQRSTRPEIVQHRKASTLTEPHLHDPAFRALVEENVKANVQRIASTVVIKDRYDALDLDTTANTDSSTCPTHGDVYIHGWVYDIENGQVSDLRVSVGPPGKSVPPSPFPSP